MAIRAAKPHRRLVSEDCLARRLGDVLYVLGIFVHDLIWQPLYGRRS